MQLVEFLSKIYFYQQTLLELAPSLLEKSKCKCQVTASMGFLGDIRRVLQEINCGQL